MTVNQIDNGFFDRKTFLFSCVIEPNRYVPKTSLVTGDVDIVYGLVKLQNLCEDYDVFPNYFVDFEMLNNADLRDFLIRVNMHEKADVGTYVSLEDVFSSRVSGFGEKNYDSDAILKKIYSVNNSLVQKCGIEPEIFKSGHYLMDFNLMNMLEQEFDFLVDSTIPAGLNLSDRGLGNYSDIKRKPFFFDDYSSKLKSKMLEIPVSTIKPEERDDFLDYARDDLEFSFSDYPHYVEKIMKLINQKSDLFLGTFEISEKNLACLPIINNYIVDRDDQNLAVQMMMSSGSQLFGSYFGQDLIGDVLEKVFENNRAAGIDSFAMSNFYNEYRKKEKISNNLLV